MRSRVIIGLTVVAFLSLIGGWAWISRPEAALAPTVTVQEAQAAAYVELGRSGILTSENFVGHKIRVVEGTVLNVSAETLLALDLLLVFRGTEGESVFESREAALTRPLAPGEEIRYVFRFENLPEAWDYRVPEVEVASVGY